MPPKKTKQATKYDWPEFDYAFNFGLLTPTNEDLPRSQLTGFSIPSQKELRRILVRPVLLAYGDDVYLFQFHSWGTIKFKVERTRPIQTLARVMISDIEGKPRRREANPLTGFLPPLGISQSRAGIFFVFDRKIEFVNLKGELYDCDYPSGLHRPRE